MRLAQSIDGRVTYTKDAEILGDKDAVILLVPEATAPDAPLAIDGLRPDNESTRRPDST